MSVKQAGILTDNRPTAEHTRSTQRSTTGGAQRRRRRSARFRRLIKPRKRRIRKPLLHSRSESPCLSQVEWSGRQTVWDQPRNGLKTVARVTVPDDVARVKGGESTAVA